MLSKSPRSSLVAAVLAGATALAASGCGSERPPDVARGKELFTQKCGACHILQNANTKGVQGPNLDLAFKQSVADGLGRSTIAGVVENQIDLPQGNQMPADLYKGAGRARRRRIRRQRDRQAGRGRRGAVLPAPPRPMPRTSSRSRRTRAASSPTRSRAPRPSPARSRCESKNDASVPHNIAIKGDGEGPVVQGGKTSEVSANLKAGKLRVLLLGAGPRAGRHEGRPDRQVAGAWPGALASRSTTTWVTWMSKRARARSTTSRSSQFERPGGCVEMITSWAGNRRRPSSIACTGSSSPMSPSASKPSLRRPASSVLEPPARLLARGVLLVGPVLDLAVERRAHDLQLRLATVPALGDLVSQRAARQRLVGDHQDPVAAVVAPRRGAGRAASSPAARRA